LPTPSTDNNATRNYGVMRAVDAPIPSMAVLPVASILSRRGVEVRDVSGVADEDDSGGKFQRSTTAVFDDFSNRAVRCDGDQRIALVSRHPKIAIAIKRQPISAFEQRTLGQ
jgi:hypothetical protein